MKRGSTLFLRATLVLMGFVALALCALVLPALYREWPIEFPTLEYLRYPIIGVLSVAALLFLAALYQTWKLLDYIDKNEAFSELSVGAIEKIKYCALVMSGLHATTMPLVYYIAEKDDAPGLIIMGMGFVFAPFVVAVFAAVLQRLLQNAIDIKKENDLTV